MKLSEIKDNWTFTKNIGATSYWFEQTDDGSGATIGPEEVLEIGCQLEAENEVLREFYKAVRNEIPAIEYTEAVSKAIERVKKETPCKVN